MKPPNHTSDTAPGKAQMMSRLKKLSSFSLAVVFAGITEGGFYLAALKFATFGPCAPGNWFGYVFMKAHMPAFTFASIFTEVFEISLGIPFMVLFLVLVYWPVIALWRADVRRRVVQGLLTREN